MKDFREGVGRAAAVLLVLFLSPCLAFAQLPAIAEKEDQVEIKNDHYLAIIAKSQGGMLASLRSPDGRSEFLKDHRIYTDYGFYAVRGHVGTQGEAKPEVAVKRGDGGATLTSKGTLRGQPAEKGPPIPYRVTYSFDRTSRIQVECEVTPFDTQKDVEGFLAACFVVPNMKEWAVNTVDGIIREDTKEMTTRNYESRNLWTDARQPMVGFVNADGTSLLVDAIASDGPMGLQNIIIHGKSFFLAWLSGQPVRVPAAPCRVRFSLIVGQGDPMR